jgi:hypothetical protein
MSFLKLELEVIELPIKIRNKEQQKLFMTKAVLMLNLNNEIAVLANKFQTYLQQNFQLEKLSKKLQNWHELEFGDFIKELNKAIKIAIKRNNINKELKPLTKKKRNLNV